MDLMTPICLCFHPRLNLVHSLASQIANVLARISAGRQVEEGASNAPPLAPRRRLGCL